MVPLIGPTLWVLLVIGTIGISAYAHIRAGFTLPNPWNDEAWFLWPAVSFMEHNTLHSAYLNPDRLMSLWPVYQVPLGLLFKITGFSFELARWTSWFYLLLSYGGILALVRARPMPLLTSAITSLFFLGGSAVVAGNMGRPEAMVWALAVWSFVFLDRGHPWKALAFSFACAWAHQAGVFFCAGTWLCSLGMTFRSHLSWRLNPSDRILLGIAGAIGLAQGFFMLSNWSDYWIVTRSIMNESMGKGVFTRLLCSNKTPILAAHGTLLLVTAWRSPRLLPPVVLGGVAFSIMLIRNQMWYEIYNHMSFLLLALSIGWLVHALVQQLASRLLPRMGGGIRRILPLAAMSLVLLPLLKFNYAHGFITGPRNYPDKLGWGWGMQVAKHPYMTEADITAVVRKIERHTAIGRPCRVFFMPEGDGLFYHGRLPANTQPYYGLAAQDKGDMAIVHVSRHQPEWWRKARVLQYIEQQEATSQPPFHVRENTEQWVWIPLP